MSNPALEKPLKPEQVAEIFDAAIARGGRYSIDEAIVTIAKGDGYALCVIEPGAEARQELYSFDLNGNFMAASATRSENREHRGLGYHEQVVANSPTGQGEQIIRKLPAARLLRD